MHDMSMEEMQRRGIFKELGSDGARLNNVMTTMADRVDILRKHLETSNKAFEEGEAVISEYMIQNETAAAYMERAANLWQKAFTNPEGVEAVTGLAKQWHEFSKELTESTLMMGSLKAALWMVLQAVKGLIVILPTLINFLLFKGSLSAVTMMVQGFWNMSKAIWAAVTASKALTAAQKWNGIATALSLIAAAFITWKSAANQAAEAAERARQRQAELDKAFAESKDIIEKSVKPLQDYKKALDESNLSMDERDKRLRAYLKNEYQPYLDYLGIEIDKVEDLADAYAQVVFAMKQKTAAEEKENYRSNMNGENRMNRIAAQAEVVREAKKAGVEIDKDFLEKNYEEREHIIYNRIFGGEDFDYSNSKIWKEINGGGLLPKNTDLFNAISSYRKLRILEEDVNNKVDRMFNTEYGDLDLENFSLEEFRKKQIEAQIEREKKRKATVLPTLPDKDAEEEARKAAQEAKQAMRKEMEDAQKESTGVLSKLEEWYRLQEAAITDARADGKMTEEQATQMIRTLSIIKNESLATARRAITTGDTEAWDELKNNVMPKAMSDASDLSQNLLETIQNVPVKVLHDNLAKFNGDAEKVFGLDSRAFFDQINAKAAGNTREAARLRAKLFKQAEKLLEQYEIVRVAQKKMQTDLEGIGIVTETYEEFAYRMQNGITDKQPKALKNGKTITDEEAYAQMGAKFIGQGTLPYRINIENADEALQWIRDFATTAQGEMEDWAQAFPDIEKWVTLLQRKNELMKDGRELTEAETEELAKIPEKLAEAIPVIRAMFYQLETSANNVAETIRRQVDKMYERKPIGIGEMQEQHEGKVREMNVLWQEKIDAANSDANAPRNADGDTNAAVELKKQRDQELIDLEYQYQQELWQIREQMGVTQGEQYQHEVDMYKNMLDKKLIDEKQFQRKKRQLQMQLGVQNAQQYNQQMTSLIDTLKNYEITATEDKYDRMIAAAQANGKDTTKIEEEKEAAILEPFRKQAEAGKLVEISEIKAAYQREVNHPISEAQIYYVLHRQGWRKIMPRSRHPKKADEEVIETSKKLTQKSNG